MTLREANVEASPRSAHGRLGGIEGLRALAATAILAFHVWEQSIGWANEENGLARHVFPSLRVGVTLFFVLSGFLLYRPFAAAVMRGEPRPSIRRYSVNRVLRILPAYWVILAIDALIVDRALLRRPLQLAANVFLVQNYVPAYQPTLHDTLGIGPAWSVVVESSWYAVLPLLALLAIVVARRTRLPPVAAALSPAVVFLVAGVAAFVAFRLFEGALGNTWQKGSLPSYASWFAVGMVLAVVRVVWEDGRLRISRWWPPVAVVASLMLMLGATKLFYRDVLLFNESQAVIAIGITMLMSLVVLTDERTRLVRALEWRPVVAVGLASYSVFLWNDPIIREMRDNGLLFPEWGGLAVSLLLASALTGVLSWLTYRYVEKPALALKRRPRETTQARTESTDAEPMGSMEPDDLTAAEARAG